MELFTSNNEGKYSYILLLILEIGYKFGFLFVTCGYTNNVTIYAKTIL